MILRSGLRIAQSRCPARIGTRLNAARADVEWAMVLPLAVHRPDYVRSRARIVDALNGANKVLERGQDICAASRSSIW